MEENWQDERARLFHRRLRTALLLVAIALLAFAIGEWRWSRESLLPLYLLKLVEFAAVGLGLWITRRPRFFAILRAVTLALFGVFSLTSVLGGTVVQDAITPAIVILILGLTTAALFPWGTVSQLVAALVGGLGIASLWWFVPDPQGVVGYLHVACLVGLAASVYVAYEIERYQNERQRVEEQLRTAQAVAERANEAKLQFLANISHDIRTPLNGIIGMTQIALETDLDPEQREYLEIVRLSADTLLSLVSDILDLSRIETGDLRLEPIRFSLRERLGDTMKGLAIRAHQKGLELAWRVTPDVPDYLVGDPARLQQVLHNLVANAVKFTESGHVFLEVEVSTRRDSEVELHFVVRDTGSGIPRDERKLIFEPFEHGGLSRGSERVGAGLGLAISRRLVELMGGRMWVESEPGQGSHFHFTAFFSIESERVRDLPLPEPAKGAAVLLVEAHALTRRVLAEILGVYGLNVHTAEQVRTAWHLLRTFAHEGTPVRLIFLDTVLPDGSGFDLAERLLSDPMMGLPHIVLLSTSTRVGDAARAIALGLPAPLIKPLRYEEVQRAILSAFMPAPETAVGWTSPRTPTSVQAHSRRRRILLAEDNSINQQLVRRLLEPRGHEVVVVENGAEAVAAVQKEPFDLILLDLQMPVLDGMSAARTIRNLEPPHRRRTPILALTAHALPEDKERCLAAGMDGYISKPIQARQLIDTVEAFLANAPGGGPPPPSTPPSTPTSGGLAESDPSFGNDSLGSLAH